MAPTLQAEVLEQRARDRVRKLKAQSELTNLELALVLGMDEKTLERHLGDGTISASRARQYLAIRNVDVSDTAVHLVVARARKPGTKPKLTREQLDAEKRRAAGLLDQIRRGRG